MLSMFGTKVQELPPKKFYIEEMLKLQKMYTKNIREHKQMYAYMKDIDKSLVNYDNIKHLASKSKKDDKINIIINLIVE